MDLFTVQDRIWPVNLKIHLCSRWSKVLLQPSPRLGIWTNMEITISNLHAIYMLQINFSMHVYNMQIGNCYLPIGRHMVLTHNYRVLRDTFTLDLVHILDRGGDWNKTLLQHEQRWIFRLQTTCHPGLNKSISYAFVRKIQWKKYLGKKGTMAK